MSISIISFLEDPFLELRDARPLRAKVQFSTCAAQAMAAFGFDQTAEKIYPNLKGAHQSSYRKIEGRAVFGISIERHVIY